MSAANLKFIKYQFIYESDCRIYNCSDLFSMYLVNYVNLLKSNLKDINYYDNDYKYLIDSLYNITIYIYNMNTMETFEIDMQNTLNF